MSENAEQPEHVPLTGTSNNRTARYLGNTVGGEDFLFERFQVGFNGFGKVRPSVVML